MNSKSKVRVNQFWSTPIPIPIGYNVKVYYLNNKFEIRTIDFDNRFSEITTSADLNTSPLNICIENNKLDYKPTISFRSYNKETFEIEYEFWIPG